MAAPHNPERYGELWNQNLIDATLQEMEALKDLVVVSGGWAWHFMTPPHQELKHAHDHKDVDLFTPKVYFPATVSTLKSRGFERTWTRFDQRQDSQDFYRYTKSIPDNNPLTVIIDLFVDVEGLPASITHSGYLVVNPEDLLELYKTKHSSEACFAVQIARNLLAEGINPISHPEMANYQKFMQ